MAKALTKQIHPIAIDEKDASRYIGMSIAYLRRSRMEGNHNNQTPAPPFIKIGRSVRYLVSDLDDWLLAHRIDRASQDH